MVESIAKANITDFELIDLAKDGDENAFRLLVERHKSKVASTIYGMIGNCDVADDIGQEVFIRFFNSMNKFRGESSLSTYLVRIAINLTLNEIKRQKRRSIFSFDKILESGSDIAESGNDFSATEDKEAVQRAIQLLSIKYRTVIVLRLIDGYSTEETAKLLNIPLGTVLSRLQRAQVKLKEYLNKQL